ncbi:hypothetical protein RHGRI_011146 [Rhododendron griersonianum]|uniref:Uncharacterized protein n=1 Tax=Rhododendron griersonianum TaxID=479676 RepID=A0AAV6KKT3_9ERIC|nr:hypothetical protein RHGRI_011146 [Rhododendron griersonianum]
MNTITAIDRQMPKIFMGPLRSQDPRRTPLVGDVLQTRTCCCLRRRTRYAALTGSVTTLPSRRSAPRVTAPALLLSDGRWPRAALAAIPCITLWLASQTSSRVNGHNFDCTYNCPSRECAFRVPLPLMRGDSPYQNYAFLLHDLASLVDISPIGFDLSCMRRRGEKIRASNQRSAVQQRIRDLANQLEPTRKQVADL